MMMVTMGAWASHGKYFCAVLSNAGNNINTRTHSTIIDDLVLRVRYELACNLNNFHALLHVAFLKHKDD